MKIAFVMDPIEAINAKKDSTLAMLLAAQHRGHRLFEITLDRLYLRDGQARAEANELRVFNDTQHWFDRIENLDDALSSFDILVMRKDPPFDSEYLYATHILERAEHHGALVANRPQALRDWSEKLATARFPQCCVPSLVSRDPKRIHAFLEQQQDIIVKPLDAMGGEGVFRLRLDDPNRNAIIETLGRHGQQQIMAQRYIAEIRDGDKRILLIDGEPIPYALARLPAKGETRANLAAGGHGRAQGLSDRDRWICDQIGPSLKQAGLYFVGIDVIGDWLTEINVTSPTGIRELEQAYPIDIAGQFIDSLVNRRHALPAQGD